METKLLQVICSFMVLIYSKSVHANHDITKNFYFNQASKDGVGNCVFHNYNGGKINVNVKQIDEPVAALEDSFFEYYFDLEKTSNNIKFLADKGIEKLEAVKNVAAQRIADNKEFLSKLTTFSRCLGAFGFAFGVLQSLTSNSHQDVIKATNEAIARLTDDINNKFSDMKDYIDNTELKIKEEKIKNLYISFENNFEYCGKLFSSNENDNPFSNDQFLCIIGLFEKIISNANNFRPKFSKITEWSDLKKPHMKEVKEIEVSFHLHHKYCTLYLKIGGLLYEMHKNDKTKRGIYYTSMYSEYLKNGADDCARYAEFGLKWILDIHVNSPNCEKSIKCDSPQHIYEGYLISKNTADLYKCYCVFDGAQKHTDICYHNMVIRVDGREVDHWIKVTKTHRYSYNFPVFYENKEIAKEKAKEYLYDAEKKYLSEERIAIEKYWYINGLNQIPTYKAISKKFAKLVTSKRSTIYEKMSLKDNKRIEELLKQAQAYYTASLIKTSNSK